MALKERDIAGNVLALVGAWKTDQTLETKISNNLHSGQALDNETRKKLKQERAANQLIMEQVAVQLATGVLVDLNRAADALERIAAALEERIA